MKESLGKKIQLARIKKNVSLRTASKEMDFSAMYLSEIEHDKKQPSNKILEKIAGYYNIDFFDLVNLKIKNQEINDSNNEIRTTAARKIYNLNDKDFSKVLKLLNTINNGEN